LICTLACPIIDAFGGFHVELDFYRAIGELPNFVLILSNFWGIICNFFIFKFTILC
jgi:hypothetical protein